jgi:hypothetical protein
MSTVIEDVDNFLDLVWEVSQFTAPYSQHITLNTFQLIEQTPTLLEAYKKLPHHRDLVNQTIGRRTKARTGMDTLMEDVPAWGTSLIKSYTMLSNPHR